jgi:hypothetical protein
VAVSRTLLAAEEMVSAARSRALVSEPLLLGRERDRAAELARLRLARPRVRLGEVRLAESGLDELDDPPRDREDRARLAAAVACGLRPSLPLLPAFEAPCPALESDALPLEPRVLRDVAALRCVVAAIT